MSLSQLSLTHFRNFGQQSLEFSDRLTLIVGRNGQGKTNLVEAVYLLLQGRDFRTNVEREALQQGEEAALIEGSGVMGHQPQRWRHAIVRQGRRTHSGPVAPLVLFSPDDVYLAKGSPERRRRFLDLLLSAHDARYAKALRAYTRVLLQRNRALKEAGFHRLVEDFTPMLVREGLYLWRRRIETINALLPQAKTVHENLSLGEPLDFSLQYGGWSSPITTEEQYAAALEQRQREELVRQTTLVGPHRDDLAVLLGGLDTRVFASQGQLRTIALSLKLATYAWLFEETGTRPMILLDDVLSELDAPRRQEVLAAVSLPGQQTIVTDTEPRSYAALDPLILEVNQGEVRPWTKRTTST